MDDDDEAPIYLSHEERQKLQRLVNAWVRELMDDVSTTPPSLPQEGRE